MKIYSHYGINDFIICLGYRGYIIKEYFSNYFLHMADVTFHMAENRMEVHHEAAEPWRVTLVDTGIGTATGGRLKRILPYVKDDPAFFMTYGDGVADVDLNALRAYHESHGKLATVTAVYPPTRFGVLDLDEAGLVTSCREKPHEEGGRINGGFFILSPRALDGLAGDASIWEREGMEGLVARRELMAFNHYGFWQPMDTLREKTYLEEEWASGRAKWKVWG